MYDYCILNAVCDSILNAVGLQIDCILNAIGLHIDCILNALSLHFNCILNAVGLHSYLLQTRQYGDFNPCKTEQSRA